MFGWIIRPVAALWRNRRTNRARKHRQIFTYWDGARDRRIDPVSVLLAMEGHETFNLERHSKDLDAGDSEAIKITCGAIRDIFDVTDYDPESGTGLMLSEQLGLFALYMAYLESLKKSTSSSPTPAPNTEESISPDSSEPTTSDSPPSGSTDADPTSSQQTE